MKPTRLPLCCHRPHHAQVAPSLPAARVEDKSENPRQSEDRALGDVGELKANRKPKKNGPEPLSPGPFILLATYAAICFTDGVVALISIFRGKAATVIGAVISNTPFTYSAVSFSTITPSGSVIVLSKTP